MDAGARPNLTRFPFVDKMAGPVRYTCIFKWMQQRSRERKVSYTLLWWRPIEGLRRRTAPGGFARFIPTWWPLRVISG